MARLYEYQGKAILARYGIKIPRGKVIDTRNELVDLLGEIGLPVVLKGQLWITGRKEKGAIRFADTQGEAEAALSDLLQMTIGKFRIEKVLVEERIDVERECFAGIVIDDEKKSPVLIFSPEGGSGVEAKGGVSRVIDPLKGLARYEVVELIKSAGITGRSLTSLSGLIHKLYSIMREYDARAIEVNPIALTKRGDAIALDCHITIDDYAVYRHPDLGIEVAREFDRPPTELERIAYKVEAKDYRGTFYFFQIVDQIPADGRHIGFHGAGGGGSMFSMDALVKEGYQIANFCDTSGNPPASKVYRAAKIILSQPNIAGYFASGSGVASQEQIQSARGLVKAFLEEGLEIPAVIRLGGNMEEEAIRILKESLSGIPAEVEGYGKDDPPEFCAQRLKALIRPGLFHKIRPFSLPEPFPYGFETFSGILSINHDLCRNCDHKGCIESCRYGILKLEDGVPVLALDPELVKKGRCIECLACEQFCHFKGKKAIRIILPIPGLSEYRERLIDGNTD
ncbi:hypothetical protein DRP53_09540 [candidate division WOR-3 bacterium]|uniref:Uncharacterized protein n=1 Tax=candidate division WOR-3 bacterium TaxID=2052148 RepID=A0A660SDU7_UNCW3|nr:MAG: hypothetical protein DRP53_09540 [candidate division WOR-3 bacterium]